jgi:hypothetical protein
VCCCALCVCMCASGTLVAERILYLPSVGFCLLIGRAFLTLKRRAGSVLALVTSVYGAHWCRLPHRTSLSLPPPPPTTTKDPLVPLSSPAAPFDSPTMGIPQVVLTALVVLGCYRTSTRIEDWRDESSLFTSAVAVCPNSAKIRMQMGKVRKGVEAKGLPLTACGWGPLPAPAQPTTPETPPPHHSHTLPRPPTQLPSPSVANEPRELHGHVDRAAHCQGDRPRVLRLGPRVRAVLLGGALSWALCHPMPCAPKHACGTLHCAPPAFTPTPTTIMNLAEPDEARPGAGLPVPEKGFGLPV